MEQKLKDRIDEAAKILNKQKAEYKAQFNEFMKNMFTPEIKEMIYTIIDATNTEYCFENFDADKRLTYSKTSTRPYVRTKHGDCYHSFGLYGSIGIKYVNDDFCELESHIKNLRENQKWFKVLQNKAPEIIQDITQKYKDITETQTDQMDEIFRMLDVEQEPTRHIKVTVEWI